MTRTEPFGGWREWLDMPMANDAAVAFCAVVALFITHDREGEPLISWEQASNIPWGVLLLFAGGITLAKGFVNSGLSGQVGELLPVLPWYRRFAITTVALLVTALTEATSNTATTALLMPILAAASMAADIDPLILMVPAAMSASCAFMLPVATAPNAVFLERVRSTFGRWCAGEFG